MLGYEGACKDCDLRRGFGVIVAVKRARDVPRLPVEAFSVRVMPLLELNGAKIDEIVGKVGMTLAVELPVHCKNTLVQGFRHGIVSDVKMAVGQDSESLREIIDRAAGRRLKAHGILQYLYRVFVRTSIF